MVAGGPGTGKSVLLKALAAHDPKRLTAAVVGRTLHTYTNTVRLLCEALDLPFDGRDIKVEARLIEQARRAHQGGRMFAVLVDDAHLLAAGTLRKLRLLLAEFPHNHNLVLFAQPGLLGTVQLAANEDLRSRLTYSALLRPLPDGDVRAFILDQFDAATSATTASAMTPSPCSPAAGGVLRHAANLTQAALVQAARDRQSACALAHVNRALVQPHWRRYGDLDLSVAENTDDPQP